MEGTQRRLTLLYQLHLASQASRRFMRLALAGTTLGGEEYALYSYLYANGARTLSQTARDLGMPITSLATMLRQHVESGRILRRPHPRDGRARLLSLSEAGEAILTSTFPAFSEAYRRILAAISEAGGDVEELFRALDLLRTGITAASEELELGEAASLSTAGG